MQTIWFIYNVMVWVNLFTKLEDNFANLVATLRMLHK